MKAFELAASQPWAILPEMLTTIISVAARETDFEAVSAKLGHPLENTYQTELRDGIAILPISGPVMRYANLFSKVSGATSIEILATDFNQALKNTDVKAIVLSIDSPGGTVAGVNEFSEMIYAARGRKPIISYVSGIGASAAYWIASAADEIVIDATASVGSIGVISVQTDETERKAKEGIKEIQIVSSLSPRKRPDISTEEGRADMQSMVDSIAQVFFKAVARNRNVSADTVLSDFGQGGLLVGASAVSAGLADRIGSLENVIAGLSGTLKRGNVMTEKLKSETQEMTMEMFVQRYPAMANSLRMEGAESERKRIQSVEEQLIPGHESLINSLKSDGKTTGAEAAIKVLAAEKEQRMNVLQNLRADAPLPVPQPAVALFDNSQEKEEMHLPLDEKCKATWQLSSTLRAEFGTLDSYVAYTKAYENGQVKVLRNQTNGVFA